MKSVLTRFIASTSGSTPPSDGVQENQDAVRNRVKDRSMSGPLASLSGLRNLPTGNTKTANRTRLVGADQATQSPNLPVELLREIVENGDSATRDAIRFANRRLNDIAEVYTDSRRITDREHLRNVRDAMNNGRYPHTTHLDASGLDIQPPVWTKLKPFSKLGTLPAFGMAEKLDVQENSALGSIGLRQLLGKGKKIRELNASGTRSGDAGAMKIAKLPLLQKLMFCNENLTLTGVKALAAAPQLVELDLSDSHGIDDDCAAALAENKNLRELLLNGCSISNLGVQELMKNRALRKLGLAESELDENGFAMLAEHPSLEELDVSNSLESSDACAIALSLNPRLKVLAMSHANIQADGAIALSGMSGLSKVTLSSNMIDDRGARALAANTQLRYIDLRNNPKISEKAKREINEQAETSGRTILF
ncbi:MULTISPECIES: hypothetical protein [Burkholderiaceae]|uniref:hypothetical protein n=1 Tax=Burkholderiaceae TaxID=119060 RepID=UPI0014219611|nr:MULTISPECIES: hypothetical protein [Burkholderiaceae]MBN3848871.1 hypothetical protein [Paraburkholderia sp. Ac-20342]